MKKNLLNINSLSSSFLRTSLTLMISAFAVTSAYANTYVDKMVAVVNESPILQSELNAAIYDYKKLASGSQHVTKQKVLSNLISRELQLELAKRANVTPKDGVINEQLTAYAKAQGYNSVASLQKAMDAKKEYSFARLRQQIIDDLSIEIVRNSQVANKINLTDLDINTYLASPEGIKLNQNQYQTVHIRVPFPVPLNELSKQQLESAEYTAKKIAAELRYTTDNSNRSIANIISKHQATYPLKLQGGNMGFNKANSLPVNLADKIIGLSLNEVNEPVTTPRGIDIIKLADKKVSDNMLVPQWRTRHILIAVNDYQDNNLAKYKINGLYQQLLTGADFAKLAATYSNDPGSAGKGGDLNWVSEGVMVDEFENIMKRTPVERYSQPFKTQFGWHILQVIDTRQYDASNDIRRKMAREILYKRMAPQATQDWLNELRANAYIVTF